MKSLCPWRAAPLLGSTEKRAAFVCLVGLRAASFSEGWGVCVLTGLLHLALELNKWLPSLGVGDLTDFFMCAAAIYRSLGFN